MIKTLGTVTILVSLLLVGCGKIEEKAPWPGHVRAVTGFAESERASVWAAVDSLNDKAGKPLVSKDEKDTNFSIEIVKVSAASWPQARAGFATVRSTECKVEISDSLFTTQKTDYLYPVVWHELGHCAGLSHIDKEGEIMSPTTSILASYPANFISRFIKSVRDSAGI